MTGDDAGRIITFYSYKGGTGRTMALANTAWILASAGKAVLVVDWDLDAPGLDRFLHPFLSESQLRSTPGVLELVSRSTQSMLQSTTIAEQKRQGEPDSEPSLSVDMWAPDGIPLNSCLIQVDWDFPEGVSSTTSRQERRTRATCRRSRSSTGSPSWTGRWPPGSWRHSSVSSSGTSTTSSSTAAPGSTTSPTSAPSTCRTRWSLASPRAARASRARPAWPSASTGCTATGTSGSCPSPCGSRTPRPIGWTRPGDRSITASTGSCASTSLTRTRRTTGGAWRSPTGPSTPTRRRWPPSANSQETPRACSPPTRDSPKSSRTARSTRCRASTSRCAARPWSGTPGTAPRVSPMCTSASFHRTGVGPTGRARSWSRPVSRCTWRRRERSRARCGGTRSNAASSRPRTPWSSSPRPI